MLKDVGSVDGEELGTTIGDQDYVDTMLSL